MSSAKTPKIAFVAVDLRWEDETGYFAPFSYAAYKLEAAIRACEEFEHIETKVFELVTRDAQVFLDALIEFEPTMVAASTYLWSLPTFVELARLLRKHDPSIAFVMGGPSARRSMLELPAYRDRAHHIDALVFGDGEVVIRQLARHHMEEGWRDKVPGLNYRTSLGWRSSGELGRPVLDDYVTPYHTGTAPPGKMGFFESYRGCPIACAFCQWGDQRADRVHGPEYLADMLRHLDASGVKDVLCLDAALNLSPRAFRALLEAEREVRALANRRLQCHLYPLMLQDEHHEFIELVGHFHAAIGVQSLDPQVLAGLGRPFEPKRFTAAIDGMRDAVTLDMEFIMGLPGDNPRAFRETFHKIVDMGDNIRVFWCLALPDAFLDRADELNIQFDPETLMVETCNGWTHADLRREWEYMIEFGAKHGRFHAGPNWLGFTTPAGESRMAQQTFRDHEDESEGKGEDGAPGRPDALVLSWSMPQEIAERLRARLLSAPEGWQLRTARRDRASLFLEFDSPGGGVVLEAVTLEPGMRSFHAYGGVAYSHRGELQADDAKQLRQIIELLHADASPMIPAAEPSRPAHPPQSGRA